MAEDVKGQAPQGIEARHIELIALVGMVFLAVVSLCYRVLELGKKQASIAAKM